MYGPDLATLSGLVNSLLEAQDMPLDFRPGDLLPGRHQVPRVLCLGSLPLTHHFTFQNTGSTSAYPRHYPGPWLLRASFSPMASGWHLLRGVIRPTEDYGRLLRSQLPLFVSLGRCYPPGLCGSASRSVPQSTDALSFAFWLQRISLLRWL